MQKITYILGLLLLSGFQQATAQFTITDDFRGNGSPDIILGDDAEFTSGNQDPINQGWLRLNPCDGNSKGYAFINRTVPSTLGVLVDFEYKTWRDENDYTYSGADGFAVFLFDGTVSEEDFQLGGYGGSLGYAPHAGAVPPTLTGLTGGYIGVGFDEYGNFANPTDGTKNGGPGFRPNSIVLRGPTTNNLSTTNEYLDGVTLMNNQVLDIEDNTGNETENEIDYNTTVNNRPDDATFYRRVQIEILPTGTGFYDIIVRWKKSHNEAFVELFTYTTDDAPPALLKLGFAASTGGGINYHELRNLLVTTPGNLRVTKLANKDVLRSVPGSGSENEITYTLEVTNDTDAYLNEILVEDQLTDVNGDPIPAGMFEITNISHSGFTSVTLPSTPITSGNFNGTVGLEANSTGTITVAGTLSDIPQGNMLRNTVTISQDDITDEDLENNTSTVNTPVIAEDVDLTLVKEVDDECIDFSNGNSFEVKVVNMGDEAAEYRRTGNGGGYNRQRLAVTKVIPPNYDYDDSATDYTTSFYQNALGNPRWIRVEEENSPNTGYTTYTYIARGPNNNEQELEGNGSVYGNNDDEYFIKYTITPPSGTTVYDDETTVEYRSAHGNMAYDGINIEEEDNLSNNTVTETLAAQPNAPQAEQTVYYCQGETASQLTVTADSGNTLNWYTDENGFPLNNAPTPNTDETGSTLYYVTQTSESCESDFTEIEVVVLENPTSGSISENQEICSYTQPDAISSAEAGTGFGNINYRWEFSEDSGNTWGTVDDATAETYQPDTISTATQFRRITVATNNNGHSCQSAPTEPVTITVKTCKLLTNPMLINRTKNN